jgi:hypothetical protein
MAVLGMTFAKTIMPETVMERLSILVAAKGRAMPSVVKPLRSSPRRTQNPRSAEATTKGTSGAGSPFLPDPLFGRAEAQPSEGTRQPAGGLSDLAINNIQISIASCWGVPKVSRLDLRADACRRPDS